MRGLIVKSVMVFTRWRWVRWIFTRTRVGRRVALRFVAGETIDEAVAAVRRINAAGMTVSLDHLGEHVTGATAAVAARDAYLACIDRIAAEGLDANISIKLTQLGMGVDDALCADSLERLAQGAGSAGITVTIDMEESAHTVTTLGLYSAAQQAHGNLGIALQAYLRRTPDDLEAILPFGGHIRLCKGAYDEAEAIAFRSRDEVNTAYDRLTRVLMPAEGVRPAIATHDEHRIVLAEELGALRHNPWEFQMLYGVRAKLQRELVAAGYAMRIYVPYGDSWYPYLTRRMAERPANLWFFLRALFGR